MFLRLKHSPSADFKVLLMSSPFFWLLKVLSDKMSKCLKNVYLIKNSGQDSEVWFSDSRVVICHFLYREERDKKM